MSTASNTLPSAVSKAYFLNEWWQGVFSAKLRRCLPVLYTLIFPDLCIVADSSGQWAEKAPCSLLNIEKLCSGSKWMASEGYRSLLEQVGPIQNVMYNNDQRVALVDAWTEEHIWMGVSMSPLFFVLY